MVANLTDNVRRALAGYNIFGAYGWLDSTVALYWIKNKDGEWKQFVFNRVAKIQQKELIWRHCPTTQNPADIGSRGANIQQLRDSTWWTGPTWLADENKWPTDITLLLYIIHTIVMKENNLNDLLVKWNLWKVLRIVAWIFRFVSNATKRGKTKGVPTTNAIHHAETFWIKVVQEETTKEETIQLLHLSWVWKQMKKEYYGAKDG